MVSPADDWKVFPGLLLRGGPRNVIAFHDKEIHRLNGSSFEMKGAKLANYVRELMNKPEFIITRDERCTPDCDCLDFDFVNRDHVDEIQEVEDVIILHTRSGAQFPVAAACREAVLDEIVGESRIL